MERGRVCFDTGSNLSSKSKDRPQTDTPSTQLDSTQLTHSSFVCAKCGCSLLTGLVGQSVGPHSFVDLMTSPFFRSAPCYSGATVHEPWQADDRFTVFPSTALLHEPTTTFVSVQGITLHSLTFPQEEYLATVLNVQDFCAAIASLPDENNSSNGGAREGANTDVRSSSSSSSRPGSRRQSRYHARNVFESTMLHAMQEGDDDDGDGDDGDDDGNGNDASRDDRGVGKKVRSPSGGNSDTSSFVLIRIPRPVAVSLDNEDVRGFNCYCCCFLLPHMLARSFIHLFVDSFAYSFFVLPAFAFFLYLMHSLFHSPPNSTIGNENTKALFLTRLLEEVQRHSSVSVHVCMRECTHGSQKKFKRKQKKFKHSHTFTHTHSHTLSNLCRHSLCCV